MPGIDDRAKNLSMGGALLAALAASSCCLGPLLLAALGVGGAGAAGTLGVYRPYLLVGTAALLGAGFYFSYRKPRGSTADACGCVQPRSRRAGRIGLWVAAFIVALAAAAPPLLARWAEAKEPPTSSGTGAGLATAVIAVPGIDCEACAAPMRAALAKAGGFRGLKLDIPRQAITVTYEPASGRVASYVVAIRGLGYEATVPNEGAGQR